MSDTAEERVAAATVTPRPASGLGMSGGRLEAFSDGVFAVAITLLILDLHAPEPGHGSLAHGLGALWPQYLAYLVSFLVIGIIWLNHHATIQLLARTDHTTQVLNLLLLLPVSVLPWPTSVLAAYARHGSRADQHAAVLLYGGVSSAMALAFNLLWRHVMRRHDLWRAGVDAALVATRQKRYRAGPFVYPVATVIGLLDLRLFIGLMLALAVLYLLPTPDVRST